jgi:hypothetical protein
LNPTDSEIDGSTHAPDALGCNRSPSNVTTSSRAIGIVLTRRSFAMRRSIAILIAALSLLGLHDGAGNGQAPTAGTGFTDVTR